MTHATTALAPPPSAAARRPAVRRRPGLLGALGLFVLARLAGAGVLAGVAWAAGKRPLRLLGHSWDSRWYLGIAEHGYGRTLRFGPDVVHSDLAFFPLYPALVRAVTALTPLNGGSAGLLVSWTAAAVAACGIYAVARLLRGPAVAAATVLLWGLLPHSVVLSMAYTEPVLTAFAAWALYAVLTGRWVWAGALAAAAGVSRPNGFAVAAAVVAAGVCEAVRARRRAPVDAEHFAAPSEAVRARGRGTAVPGRGEGSARAVRGRGAWGPAPYGGSRARVTHRLWTGIALAPLGWLAYVLWVGVHQGDPLGGYFAVQRLWGSRFDFGEGSLRFARHLLLEGDRFVFPVTLVIVGAAVVLYALLLAERVPLPLLVYTGVLLLIALGGSGFFESKPRFLLPAFPLLLPLAAALARTTRARPWHAAVVVAALAGLSFAYGAYLVVLADTPL
ncbi:mannosyltransferase family protein [Streptomyces sp. ST1015]|uniref:mannosyltransferase family protein n=1 Tax=unclassified Streptomyces TaxID=2593676 RepID=UPI00292DF944|nr:mannosyltransferase family protein [Streptomyces sp. ST1015]